MGIEARRTPIQTFYAGLAIFITGGTGFVGKILTEKLLRSCPDISTIYLLIRSKKDKSPESRLDEMFEKPLFDRVKNEVPNFRRKIVPIIGNLDTENFGLSENDKNILINQSFIHVSTAYANCHVKHIEERFYSYPINHEDLITFTRNLHENIIEEKISRISSQWPNTYTFTKAIAEGLLRDESGNLPVGIFRPAIVLSSAEEPLVGWIDNMYGPQGVTVSWALGFTRFLSCNPDVKANIVPVDFTVNALIASAWNVYNQFRRGKNTLIYNFVSPVDGPTWNEYRNAFVDTNKTYPLYNAKYFPFMIYVQHKILYRICVWLGHFLPALIIDAISICINRSPRMWKLCKKVDKFSNAIEPFCTNEWSFSTDNVQAMWSRLSKKDQKLFQFNMVGFDWTKYLFDHYMGMRLYLLNEDDSTLEISRIRYKRLYWIHQILKIVFAFAVLWIVWLVFTIICT
ncbi:putative fatty acyl-CoA reductase CG5065 isoform X2 [Temnothorax longispinosus]|uniref:putative fatty acyl-CoA reductase CG5065 isoform X2 n=1 Tax=Temnothorax longispinosus TaxID=300112 RepID=UPI003A98EA71